jgi:hypothetical protein
MGMGGLFNSFIRPSEKLAVTSHGDGVNGTKEDAMFTLERQEFFIQDALKRVRQAANKDKTIQVISGATEEEDVDRDAALAAMMGINHGSEDTSAAPIDKTAVRARRSLDRVEAVRGCATLECLRVAHEKPPGKAKFNFPHFMIVGFQKSATTSLHYHLVRHPSVSRPWDKEPEFFS